MCQPWPQHWLTFIYWSRSCIGDYVNVTNFVVTGKVWRLNTWDVEVLIQSWGWSHWLCIKYKCGQLLHDKQKSVLFLGMLCFTFLRVPLICDLCSWKHWFGLKLKFLFCSFLFSKRQLLKYLGWKCGCYYTGEHMTGVISSRPRTESPSSSESCLLAWIVL